jgi:hypothetical protein
MACVGMYDYGSNSEGVQVYVYPQALKYSAPFLAQEGQLLA